MCARHLTLLAFTISLLACSIIAGEPNPTPHPEAALVLAAFATPAPDLEPSFEALDRMLVERPSDVEGAALAQLDTPHPDARFAAVYALANSASSERGLQALRDLLQSEAVEERALAAEGLLLNANPDGVPVLITMLDDPTPLPYTEPPTPAWRYARMLLLTYFEQDHGLLEVESLKSAATSRPAWEAWWQEAKAELVWDQDQLVFREQP